MTSDHPLTPEEYVASLPRLVKCWLCKHPGRAEVERSRRERNFTSADLAGWIAARYPDNLIGVAAIQRHFREGHHEQPAATS